MSVTHLPWEGLSGSIYHARDIKPRKKWVIRGGWFLACLLFIGGMVTRYRALVLFGLLFILTLMMVKDTVVTKRGIEIFYQMRITSHYDFWSWDMIEAMLCEDRNHPELMAIYFTYGDRVKRLFFPKEQVKEIMAFALEQNPKIKIKKDQKTHQDPKKSQNTKKKR